MADPSRAYRTPTGHDESARLIVAQIIDSYALTMVGDNTQPYVEACADDVIETLLGWPVTYTTPSAEPEAGRCLFPVPPGYGPCRGKRGHGGLHDFLDCATPDRCRFGASPRTTPSADEADR